MKKAKREWTPEQKAAAAERMKQRWANKAEAVVESVDAPLDSPVAVMEKPGRDPEVQAILDSMTPERRAKLAQIQAKTLATNEAQAALVRHEEEKAKGTSEAPFGTVEAAPSGRVGSREVSLIVKTDGTMASKDGPCLCGAAKREWHPICCKEAKA